MNYSRKIKKFQKNSKALSPVVASIILIAVTVAVSVVVAAWMGGMTLGLMGSTEQVSITNIQFSHGTGPGGTDQIICLVQNSGGSGSTIVNTAFVNGVSEAVTATTIPHNNQGSITINLPAGTNLQAGTAYSVKFVTAKGTQVSSSATYSP